MTSGPSLRTRPRSGQDGGMEGAVLIVIVLLVAMPVGVLISGGIGAALLGFALERDNELENEGSELLETNI